MEIKETIANKKVDKFQIWMLTFSMKEFVDGIRWQDFKVKWRGWRRKKRTITKVVFWFLVRASGRCWIGYEKPSWTRNCLINGSPRVDLPNPQPMNADQRCKIKHQHSMDEGKFSFSGTIHVEWSYFLDLFRFYMIKNVHFKGLLNYLA